MFLFSICTLGLQQSVLLFIKLLYNYFRVILGSMKDKIRNVSEIREINFSFYKKCYICSFNCFLSAVCTLTAVTNHLRLKTPPQKTRKNPDKNFTCFAFSTWNGITESKNVLRVPLVYYISVFTLEMSILKIIKRKKTLFLVQIEQNDPYKPRISSEKGETIIN